MVDIGIRAKTVNCLLMLKRWILTGSATTTQAVDTLDEIINDLTPVFPKNIRIQWGIKGGDCPKCNNWCNHSYNYCPTCGTALDWRLRKDDYN